MRFGKQTVYCINCGKKQYTNQLSKTHVLSLMCSSACRADYDLKYARCVMGKNEEESSGIVEEIRRLQ